jgi:hypothetical protein
MPAQEVLILLLLLTMKHFIVDFPLQVWSYQYANKGTYGHPGGLLHSGLHGIGTMVVLMFFVPAPVAVYFGLIDAGVHYHIDWAKMNLNKRFGWGPTTHNEFWILLGFDQLLHSLTYLAIVWFVVNGVPA